MVDQQDNEKGILVGPNHLFAEAARRAEKAEREAGREAERKQAARTVLQWLNRLSLKEEINAGITIKEIAETVIEGLKEGRIFFAVRPLGERELPVRAENLTVNFFPPKETTNPNYPNQVIKTQSWGKIVVLAVKREVEASELSTESEEELKILYQYDQGTLGRERIKAEDLSLIKIKDDEIGRFPQLA